MKVFVFGTCKRGFPLHHGVAVAQFCGEYCTAQPYPMLIAGPWFAPMMFNEPGVGHHVSGELYDLDEPSLARLDAMESIGQPGNLRIPIEVAPLHHGQQCIAFVYMKSRALADPVYTDYLSSYQDRRFIPPKRRGAS
jgi:gamma-glutamylaminecyclotransferase